MNKSILSLAAISALAVSSFGASDLAGAFKEGKATGQVRAMYIKNDKAKTSNDPAAFGIGGKLGYETASLYGISAGATFYTSQDLGTKNNDVGDQNTEMLDENAKSYSLLGQAYLVGQYGKTTVKVGRQQLDTPLAASDDARMIPNLFEAAVVINTDLPNTTLIGAYVARMAGWDSSSDKPSRSQFNSMSRSVLAGLADGNAGDKGVYAVAAIYSGIKDLTLQGWYYNAVDVLTAPYLQADYSVAVGKDMKLSLAAQYYMLKSQGKTKSFLDANGLKLDYNVFGAKAALALESIGLTPYVAYNAVSDKTGGLVAANAWGGLPEFTNMEEANLNTGFVNSSVAGYLGTGASGATVWKVGADYSLEKLGLAGRTITVAYAAYDLKDNRNGNVDSDYTVTDVAYTCSSGLVKNLDVKIAYEAVDNKVDTKDQSFVKVIANYNF